MQPENQVSPPAGTRTHAPTDILTVVFLYAVFAALWILLSDQVVAWLFDSPAQTTLASTFKGWLFIGVTSVLLYGLLRYLFGHTNTATAPGTATTPASWLRRQFLFLTLLAVPIIALTVAGIAHTFYQEQAKEVARLQAIADLRSHQIVDWLRERQNASRFIQTSRFWVDLYQHWHDANDLASRDLLLSRMKQFRESEAFSSALLLDERGEPLLDTAQDPLAIDPTLRAAVQQASAGQPMNPFGPYRDVAGRLRLDFIAPLPTQDHRPSPILVLRADPADQLFPLLETWPLPSVSGETLLFRRDGDHVLFLNELRHRKDTAVKLRVPMTPHLLATQVLRGEVKEDNLVQGVDYRGVAVLGVVRPIPGTDWFLVAKLDRAELYAESIKDTAWITLAGLLLLFGAAAGAVLFQQRQQLIIDTLVQQHQSERLHVLQLLDAIVQSSTDAIFAKDPEGCYILFNQAASRWVGKPVEEVMGRDDRALFPAEQAERLMAIDHQTIVEDRAHTLEETLDTVNGKRVLLTTKGPLHDATGQTMGLFGISHDITERKQAEEVLRQQAVELQSRNAELERFNRAVVGRELDIIALKQQINEMSRQLGREPPFPLAFLDTPAPPIEKNTS